jgi:hypothetical protein
MLIRKYLRLVAVSSVIGLPLLAAGCTENPRDVGVPGGKATGATEIGGGATTASPGGPHVGPPGAGTATSAGANTGGR